MLHRYLWYMSIIGKTIGNNPFLLEQEEEQKMYAKSSAGSTLFLPWGLQQ